MLHLIRVLPEFDFGLMCALCLTVRAGDSIRLVSECASPKDTHALTLRS